MDQDQSVPSPIPDHLPAGTQIGHFVVQRLLGAGAMGEVYLAEDPLLNRTVALKVISVDIVADPEAHARFVAEAQNAASLRHPNIVTIYDIGEYHGRPCIAMEYLSGGSLATRIKDGQVTHSEAFTIAAQITKGLQAAHQCGIVHRDINPSNIMFDATGSVRIVDFGVAQSGRLAFTGSHLLKIGTLAYMSPEQARGEPALPSSDLFSLGVLLFEMLTGRKPFSGEYEAAILYEIQNKTVPPPSSLRHGISNRTDALVLKLLCKNPDDRFKTAEDLLQALDEPTFFAPRPKLTNPLPTNLFKLALPVLVVVAALILLFITSEKVFHSSPTDSNRHAVAVLPFDNMGPTANDYFADGMTDAIITSLARSGDIITISRTSSSSYRQTTKPIHQIGLELDVDYLVTGTVLWDKTSSANKVRINASLIRVADDAQIWANSYERSLDHIFAIQSEIANDVGRALKIRLTALRHPEMRNVNPMAYDLYLRGNDYFNRGWSRSDIANAQSMYQHSVQLDSTFSLSWAMLSRCHSSMYWEYYDRTDTCKRAARETAQRALALNPELAEAHWALGYYYYHCELNYSNALDEFNRALATEPGNAELLNAIAAVERREGLLTDAADHFTRALQFDPRSHLKAFDLALTYGMLRQFPLAEEYIDKAISLAPDWNLPYLYKAWLSVLDSGMVDRADKILTDAPSDAHLDQSKYYWWLKRLTESDPRKTLTQLEPFDDTVAYFLCRAQLSRLAGDNASCHAAADSARIRLEPNLDKQAAAPRYFSSLGLAYAYLGNPARAELFGRKAVELLPASKDAFDALFLLLNLAEVHVVSGANDKAIAQLAYLKSLPGFVSAPYLKCDPLWRPLTKLPPFQRLLDSAKT